MDKKFSREYAVHAVPLTAQSAIIDRASARRRIGRCKRATATIGRFVADRFNRPSREESRCANAVFPMTGEEPARETSLSYDFD